MPKEIKNFVLLVDDYRRPSRQRNTAGSYRVGAKTPKEAIKLLRDKIGFGSIKVYCEVKFNNPRDDLPFVPYKSVVRVEPVFAGQHLTYKFAAPVHANAPRKKS